MEPLIHILLSNALGRDGDGGGSGGRGWDLPAPRVDA